MVLGGVARDAKMEVHEAQMRGDLPWSTQTGDIEEEQARCDFLDRNDRQMNWEETPVQERRDEVTGMKETQPKDEVQQGGGIMDTWFVDDSNNSMKPALVGPYLVAFDDKSRKVGALRHRKKTIITYYCTRTELAEHWDEWQMDLVTQLATVKCAGEDDTPCLGVGVGDGRTKANQFETRTVLVEKLLKKT